MTGKRGRPRKDSARINVELDPSDREMVKDVMMKAIAGEKIGNMSPLSPKAFADLVIFALGEKATKEAREDEAEKEFKIE